MMVVAIGLIASVAVRIVGERNVAARVGVAGAVVEVAWVDCGGGEFEVAKTVGDSRRAERARRAAMRRSRRSASRGLQVGSGALVPRGGRTGRQHLRRGHPVN